MSKLYLECTDCKAKAPTLYKGLCEQCKGKEEHAAMFAPLKKKRGIL